MTVQHVLVLSYDVLVQEIGNTAFLLKFLYRFNIKIGEARGILSDQMTLQASIFKFNVIKARLGELINICPTGIKVFSWLIYLVNKLIIS